MVLERAPRLPSEPVPLREARGRVLAEPAVAVDDVPGFDNSAMDGFAVLAADSRGASGDAPRGLRVVGESRAGHPASRELSPGEAIAISTGAVVPAGADAVIRVEDTRREGDEVSLMAAVEAGRNIRRAGDDIRAGERVLERGDRPRRRRGRGARLDRSRRGRLRPAPRGGRPAHRRRAGRAGSAARARDRSAIRTPTRCRRWPRRREPSSPRSRSPATTARRRARRSSGRWRPTWPSSAAASRSASTTTSARRSRRSASSSSSGASPCGPGSRPTSGSPRAERWSSACPATRSRRWSPSCSSSGRRCASCRAPIRPGSGSPPVSPTTTARSRAGRRRFASAWRQGGRLVGDADGSAGLARAHLDARRRWPGVRRDRARGRPRRRADRGRATALGVPQGCQVPSSQPPSVLATQVRVISA